MKKIAIIFLELIVSYYMISSCSCLKSENLLKSNSFNKFESLHQKKYATARERVKREKIFKQNAQQVDLMNEKARSEKSFLFFETNKFSDLTPIEFVKLHTGYRHLPVNQTSAKKVQLPVGANKTLQGSDDFFGKIIKLNIKLIYLIYLEILMIISIVLKIGLLYQEWLDQLKIKVNAGITK